MDAPGNSSAPKQEQLLENYVAMLERYAQMTNDAWTAHHFDASGLTFEELAKIVRSPTDEKLRVMTDFKCLLRKTQETALQRNDVSSMERM